MRREAKARQGSAGEQGCGSVFEVHLDTDALACILSFASTLLGGTGPESPRRPGS
jgi:hypothetical protein